MTVTVRFSLVIVIIVQSVKGLTTCDNDFNFNVTYGAFFPGNAFKTITLLGRRMCIAECQRLKECQSINHSKLTMECQLNNATSDNQLVFGDAWWTYIETGSNSTICSDKEILVPLKDGHTKCVIQRCDSVLEIDSTEYHISNTSFGADVDLPCAHATNGGYYSIGCRYECKSSGNWEVIENKGWVKVYIIPVKWSVANATCISDNATLLIIRDEAFLNDVVNVVNPIVSGITFDTTCGSVSHQFWIGATDREVEGTFKWVNGDGFTVWQSSKQITNNNSCNGGEADCSLVVTTGGNWQDRNCDQTLAYICMKSSL